MGIKGLSTFLKRVDINKNNVKSIKLSDISGKYVGVDASIFIYRFLYKPHCFVDSFITMIYSFLSNGIIPVYVFDGMPPCEKNGEIQCRKDKKDDYQKKIDDMKIKLKNNELDKDEIYEIKSEIGKLEKRVITLNKDYVDLAQNILKCIGLSYVHLEYEAEYVASQLLKNGYIDYILSEDNDLFLYGCSAVLKDYSNINDTLTLYDFNGLLKNMNISYEQFVDMCLMVGVDYSGKLNRISLNKAYSLIKEFKSIENLYKFKIITIHPDPDGKIKNIIHQELIEMKNDMEKYQFKKENTDLIGLYELFRKNRVIMTPKMKKIIMFFRNNNYNINII